MRKILFKAKRLDSGKWVEGHYFAKLILNYHCIIEGENQWEIDPNTLCQFTGLTDKGGNKIWENDIVEVSDYWRATVDTTRHLVKWNEAMSGFSPYIDYDSDCCIYYYPENSKVIGNKFDNIELLKGGNQQ